MPSESPIAIPGTSGVDHSSECTASSADSVAEVSLSMLAALIQESREVLSFRLREVEARLTSLLTEARDFHGLPDDNAPSSSEFAPLENLLPDAPLTSSPQKHSDCIISLEMLFSHELTTDVTAMHALSELVRRLAQNDPAAIGLVGQLLIWRSVSRERMPKLLGDVGDAYYACFPRTTDQVAPLEQALVDFLVRRCVANDVPNTIELVRLGERFTPSRHRMRIGDRGVEVTEIFGWVVVGPEGQVLNRAQVGLK